MARKKRKQKAKTKTLDCAGEWIDRQYKKKRIILSPEARRRQQRIHKACANAVFDEELEMEKMRPYGFVDIDPRWETVDYTKNLEREE